MTDLLTAELLELNRRLLDSIARADWQTYQDLCDPTLTAFEPEAVGHLVEGMDFHRFYFERGPVSKHHNTTMSSPHVRVMGDVAVIAYVRLIQRVTPEGTAVTVGSEETRVWQRQAGQWKHVHFHRSALA
jgi:ketosteroid isomerase-like protein